MLLLLRCCPAQRHDGSRSACARERAHALSSRRRHISLWGELKEKPALLPGPASMAEARAGCSAGAVADAAGAVALRRGDALPELPIGHGRVGAAVQRLGELL